LNESGILNQGKSIYSIIDVDKYYFISVNYKNDVTELLKKLEGYKKDIKIIEYYPFWTFTDYNVDILYKNKIVATIFGHNRRCTPVKVINVDGDFVQIGCFDFMVLMTKILSFRMKVNDMTNDQNYYNIMLSHLIEMRNYYFQKNKKNLLDDTLFQSLLTNCIGESADPLIEAKEKRKKKKKEGKHAVFRYIPPKKMTSEWKFANTSGNAIKNSKNYKIKTKK